MHPVCVSQLLLHCYIGHFLNVFVCFIIIVVASDMLCDNM